jgi:hypothetical protein
MLSGNWSLDYSPGYIAAEALSRVFSPYDFNPLDINPLRDIVAVQVDFGRKAAGEWHKQHYADISNRSTFDVSFIFEESLSPAHLPEGTIRKREDKT